MLLFMGRLNISRSVYHDFYVLMTLTRCLNITVLLRWDGLVLMGSVLRWSQSAAAQQAAALGVNSRLSYVFPSSRHCRRFFVVKSVKACFFSG